MPDASGLRGVRIAVTGASGFVGGRVCRTLIKCGAQVAAFGRRPHLDVPLGDSPYRSWDITEGPLPAPPAIDAVVHCAGIVSDWGPRKLFERCHVEGTRNVLETFPAPLPIVHLSTASVYDPRKPKHKVREDAVLPHRYFNDYARTKAIAEQLILARGSSVVLRPHAIYGPGDTVLLPRLLSAIRFGHLLAVGDGQNRISVTHVDNLVDAIVLALAAAIERGEAGVFNVTDAVPIQLDRALKIVLRATGHAERILYLPRPLGSGLGMLLEFLFRTLQTRQAPRLTRYIVSQLAAEYTLDLRKAEERLGYRPTRTLESFFTPTDAPSS